MLMLRTFLITGTVIPSPPPVVSRKRKNRDDDESGKVKKRKRGEPEPGDISDKEKVEASDDELLLGSVIADEDVRRPFYSKDLLINSLG